MGGENEFIIDTRAMDQDSMLVIKIDEMLDELEPPPSKERCIYRVPMVLRKVNEEAYTPRIVSIGPFHHNNNKDLESMEQVKKRYMKKFVRRSGISSLKSCIEFLKMREANIRDCYSERIEMDTNELVNMILVDSCFIIQFLISNFDKHPEDGDDDSLSLELENFKIEIIVLDLIMLENQVPFFVLEGLFGLATASSSKARCFLDIACNFLSQTFLLSEEFNIDNGKQNFQSIKHITDLALTLYRPQKRPQQSEGTFRSLYSLTNLTEAGVTLRQKRSSEDLFDITFTNEVLEIPRFQFSDDTEIQIRNLMALEICCYPDNSFITHYIIFIDDLVNTARDVDLLVDKKIIINYLGDNKAVAKLINKLCINVPYDVNKFYFHQVGKELNDYYEVYWHKLKATLKRKYFDTPWQTASTIAASMLILLAFIQTICSIISIGYWS